MGHAKIIGFNHNASKEGNNSIHFMWYGNDFFEPFCDNKNYGTICQYDTTASGYVAPYNYTFTHHKAKITNSGASSSATNNVGWSGSVIRQKFLPKLLEAMPNEWTGVMNYAIKYTYNPSASAVTSESDKLFILSEYEVYGSHNAAHADEANYQARYSYFTGSLAPAGRRFPANSDTGQPAAYWLRSPATEDGTTRYCCVSEIGTEEVKGSRYSLAIVPCFVIA